MARVTGKPAVCFASSGPGATNLITAIADANMDSVPVIAITGQVASGLIGTDAFQEVDTYGLMLPITKHNFLVRSAAELLEVIPEAFRIAASGRPGPVAVDIPKDVQLEAISAALAQPKRAVLCISGDGSIMMNIQELDTAVEHNLNIKIDIMNNENLGLVRQQQSLFYGARYNAIGNRRSVGFAPLAETMGARGYDLSTAGDPAAMLIEALNTSGPCVIDVPIAEHEMVFPMVPPGAANKDMIGEGQS